MPIDSSLQAVEQLLQSSVSSAVPLLAETSAHVLRAGGKRIRPRLLLLAYEAAGGQNQDYVVPLAAAVEIIHTATLVHDDINDHGTVRRGRETVNSRWGGTVALLTGDYMFTKTYEIMTPYPGDLNAILARAAIQLVEGETLQIQAARAGLLDPATYLEIITRKTAALFVACAELGANAAGAPDAWVQALSRYAFNLGLAFQITDDVLDLVADTRQLGKNSGVDRAQGRGIAAVKEGNSNSGRLAAVAEAAADTAPGPFKESLLEDIPVDAAVQRGRDKARELADLALASLEPLPPSAALDELRGLARHVLDRDH